MKMFATLVLAALLLTSISASAQSFTVSITPTEQMITVGESATYSVVITPQNGFNATVFLSVTSSSYKGTATLSVTEPNPPYSNITLKVRPSIQDTGIRTFTIKAENSGIESSATCSITTRKNTQWANIKYPITPINNVKLSYIRLDNDGNISFASRQYLGNSQNRQDSIVIYHFRNQHWESETFRTSPPDPRTYGYFGDVVDKEGMNWSITDKGIAKYDGKFITVFNQTNSDIPYTSFRNLMLDRSGYPLCTTEDNKNNYAVSRYDGNSWKSLKLKLPKDPHNNFEVFWNSNLCIDSTNRIWIPPTNFGMVRVTDTIQEDFPISGGLFYSSVSTMLCDKDGEMWFMYNPTPKTIAFSHFDGTKWEQIYTPTQETLYSFILDENKNIWACSGEGLHRYGNNGIWWTTYNKTNSPLTGRVYSVLQDKNKNFWLSSTGNDNAFYVFNPNGLVDIPLAPVSVEELPVSTESSITISPNPTSTSVTLAGISGVTSFRVVNSLGMDMGLGSELAIGATQEEINVSGLVAGIYFVQLRTPTGMITKPMMVVR